MSSKSSHTLRPFVRVSDHRDDDLGEIDSAVLDLEEEEESTHNAHTMEAERLTQNNSNTRRSGGGGGVRTTSTNNTSTNSMSQTTRNVLIGMAIIGVLFLVSLLFDRGASAGTIQRGRAFTNQPQFKQERTREIIKDDTNLATNQEPVPCVPSSSSSVDSAVTVSSNSGVSVGVGATFIVGIPPARTTFLSDEISFFRSEVARLNSGRLNILARWEDPEMFREIKKAENQWSDSDEAISTLTSSPSVYDTPEKRSRMAFSPSRFRELNVPIMWTDTSAPNDLHNLAHIHWNAAAEKRFYQIIKQQQFPNPPVDCTKAKYVLIEQWGGGFFSRYNTGMEQMARAFNVQDRQILITFGPMGVGGSLIQSHALDDYAGEGMLQYFQPFSQCQYHPHVLKMIRLGRTGGPSGFSQISREGAPIITSWRDVQPGGRYFDTQFVHLCDDWCWRHPTHGHDAPFRRLMFDPRVWDDSKSDEWRMNKMFEESHDHSEEHIYAIDQEGLIQTDQQFQSTLNERSRMWQEFFETHASAFFFRPNARIHMIRSLISDYWRTQMLRRQNIYPNDEILSPSSVNELDNSAGIFMRRGDKCPDDTYCQRTGHFRGFGLFVHGVYLEELRRGKSFSSIFVMTDDGPAFADLLRQLNAQEPIQTPEDVLKVFNQPQQSTKEEIEAAVRTGDDMTIAKTILKGRWVTHNQLSPAACFDPALRPGFEAFLASLQYLIHHNAFVIGHESSNVMYFLARMMFLKNQFDPQVTRMGPGAITRDAKDDFSG